MRSTILADEIGLGKHTVQVKVLPHYAGPREKHHDPKRPEDEFIDLLKPAKDGDAGVDLFAAEDYNILPGERALIKTGICFALPEGLEVQVRPRSGMSLKTDFQIANAPGTVDAGYRGEVVVIARNVAPTVNHTTFDTLLDVLEGAAEIAALSESQDLHTAEKTVRIRRGERVAQVVFAYFIRPEIELLEELPTSARGTTGFGSSGK